jgi:hypothetical protein
MQNGQKKSGKEEWPYNNWQRRRMYGGQLYEAFCDTILTTNLINESGKLS